MPSTPDCATANVDEFLRAMYPADLFTPPTTPRTRPFVTLTYAQSLDGKIAGVGGAQIRLSGAESMALTHRLRELHDFILVGVGTMLSDDPQLNARLPDLLPLASQPRPIVLDSALRTPTSAKLLLNHSAGIGHPPILVHTSHFDLDALRNRKQALEQAGARLVELPTDPLGRIQITSILSQVTKNGSLMVEGGATVISAFLASGLVDLVVVTIAPVFVGEGISMIQPNITIPSFKHVSSRLFGQDVVVVLRPE